MSEVIWLSERDELQDLLDTEPELVVDFTAPGWCRPCQQFAPHFEAAATRSTATFVAVDVDKADWAAVDFGIMSVPTVKLFRAGVHVKDLKERTVPKLLNEIDS